MYVFVNCNIGLLVDFQLIGIHFWNLLIILYKTCYCQVNKNHDICISICLDLLFHSKRIILFTYQDLMDTINYWATRPSLQEWRDGSFFITAGEHKGVGERNNSIQITVLRKVSSMSRLNPLSYALHHTVAIVCMAIFALLAACSCGSIHTRTTWEHGYNFDNGNPHYGHYKKT